MCRHRGAPEKLVLPKKFEISQLGGRLQKCRPSRPLGKLCLTGRSYRAQFDPTSADHRRSSFSDLVKRKCLFVVCQCPRCGRAEYRTTSIGSSRSDGSPQKIGGSWTAPRNHRGAVGARSAAVVARSNVGGGSRLHHHHWATRLQLFRHNEQPYYQQGNFVSTLPERLASPAGFEGGCISRFIAQRLRGPVAHSGAVAVLKPALCLTKISRANQAMERREAPS